MAKVRIQTHRKGMTEVLTAPGTVAFIDRRAKAVAAAANGMHDASGYVGDAIVGSGGKPRAHGMVKATDLHSMRSNAKWNTLVKALAAGGAA